MKNILSLFALFIAFGFFSVAEVKAETYMVNLDGSQGCGQYCDQLNAYLATQNTNTDSTSSVSSNGNTGYGQQAQGNSTSYPYQSYVNFPSTDAYYKSNAAANPQSKNTNGYNYVQYPYPMYSYFVNPNPNPSQNTSNGVYQSYPTPIYTYYGNKSSSTAYTQPKTTINPNSGFVLTSIR